MNGIAMRLITGLLSIAGTVTLGDVGGCLGLGIAGTAGCSAEYWTGRLEPVTEFSIHPMTKTLKFRDTKNNTLEVAGLRYDPATKSFTLDRLNIINNSAEVIDADKERMAEVRATMQLQVEYQRQLGQNVAWALLAGGEAAGKALEFLKGSQLGVSGSWGSGNITLGGSEPPFRKASASTGEPTEAEPKVPGSSGPAP